MNGKTGEPVPVWGTVSGVAFSLLAGVGGVLLAMDRERFTAGDAVGPGIVGTAIGLLIVALVLWLYYVRRWRPHPSTQFVSVPVLAGVGLMIANGPAAVLECRRQPVHPAATRGLGWDREPPGRYLVATRARTG
jgi:hypothetical protein